MCHISKLRGKLTLLCSCDAAVDCVLLLLFGGLVLLFLSSHRFLILSKLDGIIILYHCYHHCYHHTPQLLHCNEISNLETYLSIINCKVGSCLYVEYLVHHNNLQKMVLYSYQQKQHITKICFQIFRLVFMYQVLLNQSQSLLSVSALFPLYSQLYPAKPIIYHQTHIIIHSTCRSLSIPFSQSIQIPSCEHAWHQPFPFSLQLCQDLLLPVCLEIEKYTIIW